MENTIIIPTYEIEVKFSWNYPGQPIKKVVKKGYIETTNTEDRLIAEEYINSFIGNYQVGICEVSEMDILSLKRVYTYDEWVEKYKPVKNQFEDSSFEGCSFDYSEDDQWEFVKKQNPSNIWTMVDSDDFFVIIPGCHWVNRESYFITEIPVQNEDLQTEFLVIEQSTQKPLIVLCLIPLLRSQEEGFFLLII